VNNQRRTKLRRLLELGGVAAAVVLVAFGAGAIAMSALGMRTINSTLKQQQIVGTSDMTPRQAAAEASGVGLKPRTLPIPSCSVAGVRVTTGTEARCFAQYMEVHALIATGGLYYSQLPQYATSNGKGTNNAAQAVISNGVPVEFAGRSTWVEQIAISTALNASYLGSQLALFGVIVGLALLLSGLGFAILAIGGALRNPETALPFARRRQSTQATHDATTI
jgi:hypothetical protein